MKKHLLCIGLSLIAGFVLYDGISFYWAIICFLVAIFAVISLIYCLKNNSDGEVAVFGCYWCLVFAIFTFLYWVNSGTRYMTPQGSKLHLYEDCSTIKSKHVSEVTKMEGYFHGCFKDCKVCRQRQTENIEEELRNEKISDLEEKLDEIEMQKKRILRALDKLRKGEDVDTYDLLHPDSDYEEEVEDPNPYGLPSRYL